MEFAEVFGNLYGTSKRAIAEKQEKGLDVILEIDWQGALQLMALDSDITSIFLLPPSLSDLEARLQKRDFFNPARKFSAQPRHPWRPSQFLLEARRHNY